MAGGKVRVRLSLPEVLPEVELGLEQFFDRRSGVELGLGEH